MDWLFGFAILGFLFYWLVMRKAGNLKFWQVAARNPSEAMTFFATRDCFFIDLTGFYDKKDLGPNWVGPFFFSLPSTNHTLRIYCRTPDYLIAQQEFVKKVRELIDAVEPVRNFAFPDQYANDDFHFLSLTADADDRKSASAAADRHEVQPTSQATAGWQTLCHSYQRP